MDEETITPTQQLLYPQKKVCRRPVVVRVHVRVIVRTVVRVCRDFLVFELQVTFLKGFLLNLADGLPWQRSRHPIVFILLESKL